MRGQQGDIGTRGRVGDVKLLNSLVAGIGHVQPAFAVQRHAVGPGKTPGLLAAAADAEKKLAVRREDLHAVVQAADPHPVVSVDHDADRSESGARIAGLQGAETARLIALVAPGQERFPVGRQLLDTADSPLRGVKPALAVLSQKMRSAKSRTSLVIAAELARFETVF